MQKQIHRRGLLLGIGSCLAAPAIVRASSIMPVKDYEVMGIKFISPVGYDKYMYYMTEEAAGSTAWYYKKYPYTYGIPPKDYKRQKLSKFNDGIDHQVNEIGWKNYEIIW